MNRRELARVAANTRWAKPGAREDQSRTLKDAKRARLVASVDPGGVMGPDELERALVNARKAEMARVRSHRRGQ